MMQLPLRMGLFFAIVANVPVSALEVPPGTVWPQPNRLVQNKNYFIIHMDTFQFKVSGHRCDILAYALTRYMRVLKLNARGGVTAFFSKYTQLRDDSHFNKDSGCLGYLKYLDILLSSPCEQRPHFHMNESYSLSVREEGFAALVATQVWGILRGLETFSQLATKLKDANLLMMNVSEVEDKPRFKHRGLLIDTARHYLPKNTIRTLLSAMECNKMNVLHWHIVDDESFPFRSTSFPELSTKGAYNPDYLIYSHQDIEDIIEYARLRGIRVIPEFDTPGHTLSWGKGIPDILTRCYNNSQPDGLFGPMDPTKKKTYEVLESLYSEVAKLFYDDHIHLGGDEVDYKCWKSNPDILKFLEQHHLSPLDSKSFTFLENFHTHRMLQIAKNLNLNSIVWQEVFMHDIELPKQTIVHIWTGNTEVALDKVVTRRQPFLFSTCWYLDHTESTLYGGGGGWKTFYECDPFTDLVGADDLILGGEACMWGEYVDETNIVQRVWPRASAAAERLWSPSSVKDTKLAALRLEEHVCRMRQRAIQAQPPNGPGFCP